MRISFESKVKNQVPTLEIWHFKITYRNATGNALQGIKRKQKAPKGFVFQISYQVIFVLLP